MKQLLLLTSLIGLSWYCQAQAFKRVTDSTNPAVQFVNSSSTYKGLAWIDLDRDNYPDLFVSPRFLFRNNRQGSFIQLPDLEGIRDEQAAFGTSWGDLDNDGDQDCLIASIQSGLYYNDGTQRLVDSSNLLPNLGAYSGWDGALADVDNNGLLDVLFVHACCNFHPTGPFPCKMYLQQTPGQFTAIAGYEFTDQTAPYTIPTWADYDLDGDMDLFIGSGPAGTARPDYNYKNLLKETGSFKLERLTSFPFMQPQDGQVYNFIDFDNDMDLDICLTNYAGAKTRMYRNDGSSGYFELNTVFSTAKPYLSNVWGDMDNDGYIDVLLAEDQTSSARLYRNKGNGTFNFPILPGGTGGNIAGVALADYDNDGDLDFYINGQGNARSLFRNDTFAGARRWVQFSLEGTSSNRSAIGATIRVKANIGGKPLWQLRQVSAHNSFQSQSDLRQHFGLRDAVTLDSVIVQWPSGLREVFTNLPGNRIYRILEGSGLEPVVAGYEAAAIPAFEVTPNPVQDHLTIRTAAHITTLELLDLSGRSIMTLSPTQRNGTSTVSWPASVAAGTWLLRARLEDGRQHTVKIIKQ